MILNEKSTAQLEKELKLMQVVIAILTGLLLFLFIVCIYALIKINDTGFYTFLTIVPVALSATLPLNYMIIKKIKTELETRKNH